MIDFDKRSLLKSQPMEEMKASSRVLRKVTLRHSNKSARDQLAGSVPIGMLVAFTISGCSTITTGTTHELAITSSPSGANCRASRDDKVIGAVNPTPGSLIVGKSTRDMVINCTLPGHQAGVSVVKADFQAWTLGNLLIGGVVGVAVDAASGALGKYPPSVMVALAPAEDALAIGMAEHPVAPATADRVPTSIGKHQ